MPRGRPLSWSIAVIIRTVVPCGEREDTAYSHPSPALLGPPGCPAKVSHLLSQAMREENLSEDKVCHGNIPPLLLRAVQVHHSCASCEALLNHPRMPLVMLRAGQYLL